MICRCPVLDPDAFFGKTHASALLLLDQLRRGESINTPEPSILAIASPSQQFATTNSRSLLALITRLGRSLSDSDSERWGAVA
jgi:hypothetical protein